MSKSTVVDSLMSGEEKQEELCDICGGTPCDWEVYGEEVLAGIEKMNAEKKGKASNADNQAIRQSAYELFVDGKCGKLGKRKRIKITSCVIDHINQKWPGQKEKQEEMCDICGGTPCDWEVYGEEVLEVITKKYVENIDKASNADNQTIRKSAYELFVCNKHGHFAKRKKIRLASCVIDRIKEKWPEKDGNYTGYYSS